MVSDITSLQEHGRLVHTNGWELKGQITNTTIAIAEIALARFGLYIKTNKSHHNLMTWVL